MVGQATVVLWNRSYIAFLAILPAATIDIVREDEDLLSHTMDMGSGQRRMLLKEVPIHTGILHKAGPFLIYLADCQSKGACYGKRLNRGATSRHSQGRRAPCHPICWKKGVPARRCRQHHTANEWMHRRSKPVALLSTFLGQKSPLPSHLLEARLSGQTMPTAPYDERMDASHK